MVDQRESVISHGPRRSCSRKARALGRRRIQYCPEHGAAPAMREALEELLASASNAEGVGRYSEALVRADRALAAAKVVP